jgi:mRNA interferase MazF
VTSRTAATRRGEIWLAALDPTMSAEIQKTRPCVVVSPPEMNEFLRTVTVAPMTTGSHPAAYRVPFRLGGKNGLMLPDADARQAKACTTSWCRNGGTLRQALAALREMFGE